MKQMRLCRVPISLVLIFLFSLFQRPTLAMKRSYVVYLGSHSHGSELTSFDLERVTDSHYDLLGSYLGSAEKAKDAMFYSYTRYINGFAATLEEVEAEAISKNPNVLSVFLNQGRQLHTTRSWDFLGLESNGEVPSSSIWSKARYGEDTIIANLDTGVWPESESFSDEGMGPIPSRWKGICQNNTKVGVLCNRKLIGARYFNKGYAAVAGQSNLANSSPRDDDGHGTHTLSTAGGNFVSGASVFGFGNGTAKGGSPKARVAAYKVCWKPINDSACFDADIIAAFDAAIHDGVDVLSVSIGATPTDYFSDGLAIGSFHAVKAGIVVVSSAGNTGPAAGSVSNVAPWMITVGASTTDREFVVYVALGNRTHLKGQSMYPKSLPIQKFYPVITGVDAKASNASVHHAQLCFAGSLDPKKVKGKILACLRGITARVEKGVVAHHAGAVAMILANDATTGNEVVADPHLLPAAHINYTDGLTLFAYINKTKEPYVYMTRARTQFGIKPAPYMAAFSSRGPNPVTPEILKPDITAPGVGIIAAFSQAIGPAGDSDPRRVLFNTESGTSMSCPHIAGVAGLLKTLHPEWSPSAIKSAIMTTARSQDNQKTAMLDSFNVKATPFSYGSGQVRPNGAMDPGLVYDITTNDYLDFLCGLDYDENHIKLFSDEPYSCPNSYSVMDFNYPAITVPKLSGSITVTRKVKNVGSPGTYHAKVHSPLGITVIVEPTTLTFEKIGEEKMFKVTLKDRWAQPTSDYAFGGLTWSDGQHYVRSPIVVRRAGFI